MAKKTKSNRISRHTVTGVDKNNNLIFREQDYHLTDNKHVAGGGHPMDVKLLKRCILEHHADKIEHYAAAAKTRKRSVLNELADERIGVTLGKESLLHILAQRGCEGIRFYFCKNPWGRTSIAAVGVRVVTVNGQEVAQDIGVLDNHLSILHTDKIGNVLNSEVGPPYTVAHMFNARPHKEVIQHLRKHTRK